jgi:hypothetical protein
MALRRILCSCLCSSRNRGVAFVFALRMWMGHGEVKVAVAHSQAFSPETRGDSRQIANRLADLCLGTSGVQFGARRW